MEQYQHLANMIFWGCTFMVWFQLLLFFITIKIVNKMTTDVAAAIATLQADVAAQTTVETSMKTLMGGLSAQIQAIAAQATEPDVVAALKALDTSITATTSDMSAAIVANTPAAPAQ